MTFHQSSDFGDAIRAAAAHFKLRDIFIEKDYWVTYVLRNVAQAGSSDQVIFKGGTSLSKAFNCIDRFSEDIDLAILKEEGITDNQLKRIIKSVETEASNGLEYFKHPNEEKKGRNRRTFYTYPRAVDEEEFDPVKPHIQLEINCFTNPVPFEKKPIQSYVAQFLSDIDEQDLIKEYNLESFDINVLKRERTFYEKLMSLVRLSYEGSDELKQKIRHFYDLHKLLNEPDLKNSLLLKENFELITLVLQDDQQNNTFSGDWVSLPIHDSPLLRDIDQMWTPLKETYQRELSKLVWSDDLPSSDSILDSMSKIKSFILAYQFPNLK